jgi:hypothetical protein
MHLCKHKIWPVSYKEQTKLEIKQFKWIWENNPMFPNYYDNAFQTTLNRQNESTTITNDYIIQEVKLKKTKSEPKAYK